GDEVLVAFERGDLRAPYVVGALWGKGRSRPPETNEDAGNNRRTIRSRSGHVIRLDDTEGAERIEIVDSSGRSSIVIDSAGRTITVEAEGDVTIGSATGTLRLRGARIEIDAAASLTARGAQVDIEGDAVTRVKGGLVTIN
ncbi:MAG TPA: phage baseplate assembly protein V, partial [Gaiellaceae bacterium]|nr:phage baseplate assembly protein V [Gaiellaceae bacterium]